MVSQSYDTIVNQQYVIDGNDVIFMCDVPSFVADLVSVSGWVDSEGTDIVLDRNGN